MTSSYDIDFITQYQMPAGIPIPMNRADFIGVTKDMFIEDFNHPKTRVLIALKPRGQYNFSGLDLVSVKGLYGVRQACTIYKTVGNVGPRNPYQYKDLNTGETVVQFGDYDKIERSQ